jgi:hypothetical protein
MSIRCCCLKMTALYVLAIAALPVAAQRARAAAAAPRTAAVATSVVFTVTTPLTISYGESVDGYSTVSSSDGSALMGTVTFFDGTVDICTLSVTETSSCPPDVGTGFAAGTHVLTAVYSGDATHLGSTSNGVPIVVVPDVTTVSLSSSADPAVVGRSVTLTASAAGDHATPAGQVQILDGSRLIAVATLGPDGTAAIALTGLSVGRHSLTAVYAATQDFAAATSPAVQQVIEAAAVPETTVTTLASDVNPAATGQSVTFTAQVTGVGQGPVPAGVVTFLDGSTPLGTAALNGEGAASLSTALLAAGSHSISASYGGSGTAAASASSALTETVTSAPAGTSPFTLTVAGTPTVDIGGVVNLTVTVAPQQGSLGPVQLSCAKLPEESACTFGEGTLSANGGTTTLQISTMAPHSCATETSSVGSFGGPVLAGLLLLALPWRRRRPLRGLLLLLVAASGVASLSGCGNCTDLGTRPGDYTVQVIGATAGGASRVVKTIVLHVVIP